jgi:L-ribulose-5-phosphate 4-epimerase
LKKESVDTNHHVAIYSKNPHINSICHTHSTFAVVHAVLGNPLLCFCTEHADIFGQQIDCLPYEDFVLWGETVADNLESSKAVLLANHGVVTVGSSAKEAVKNAIALENIAEKNYYIQSTHHIGAKQLPEEEVRVWHERYNQYYGQK